jgi:apolipoprotein N-acyltransferase
VVRTEVTPSDRIGPLPEYVAASAVLLLALLALWMRRRTARVDPTRAGSARPPHEPRRERLVV